MKMTKYVATLFDDAGNPNKVTIAFKMAVTALQKGHSATIILMLDAVHLGKPGATGGIDIGKPFPPVSELLEKFISAGGQLALCHSCMVHHGLEKKDIDPRFEIITADDVIDLMMNAQGSLQIT